MSNGLVVFYTLTGTCRRVTELLCIQQGWSRGEVQEIVPRDSGLRGSLRCIADSWGRRRPDVRYIGPDPREFDIVVLVAPVWLQRLAGPMRSFVARWRDQLPRVAVISVMNGRGAPDAVAEIGRLLERAPELSASFASREVDEGACAARLQAFGDALGVPEGARPVRPATLSPAAA